MAEKPIQQIQGKSDRAQREEKILAFWKERDIFKKTLDLPAGRQGKSAPKGDFVFYEGPPTANGRPAIHHLEARAFKDVIPRYKTMQGYYVRRKAGWDTHGLPIELAVEKALGLKSKKDIEKYGVDKFNEECKKNVWKYVDEWENFSNRMGFWLDFEHPYVTYHNPYIEAVWSILAKAEDKKLLYKDYKVVPWCPRCGTALSSHELAQGYEDVKELSVYVKFKVKNPASHKATQDTQAKNTFLLAWTTTPWTLPGNIALAVGEDIDYVEVTNNQQPTTDNLILAKARLEVIGEGYEMVREMKGKELIGLEYEPLYPFTEETYKGKGMEKAYKVYPADFVNTEDGTGIVHTSVMYGQEDFELGTKVGLPKHHLVSETGHFLLGTGFLEGKFVKDEETGVEILKDLANRGLLFDKKKYEHSYPFCWRCHTPLIYYARDSWYIRMSKLRDELIKENQKINWEPDYIKEGRFGEWLRDIKDWAISRERYWGTPLPIWQNADGSKRIVVDSVETLKKYIRKSGNQYIGMRHGEGEHNVANVCSADPKYPHRVTEAGRKKARETAEKLKSKGITKIITSPFVRTKETAEIVAEVLGIDKSEIIEDERLSEYKYGEFNLKPREEYFKWREGHNDFFTAPEGGESLAESKQRFAEFFYDIENKYQKETILFISHGIAFEVVAHIIAGNDAKTTWEHWKEDPVWYGEYKEYDFIPLPHNENFELDLHKPYIDEVVLENPPAGGGEKYRRVKEVMDVWLDSGAVPFAQDAEDREHPGDFSKIIYPADFISEGVDQTRGWFYTMHAISTLLEKGPAFKNVICLGLLMDKNGKKMSKSIGNVVDPWLMMDKYGVDALRLWMYSVNQPGDFKNFDERNVDEINRRIFNILDNVYSFLALYTNTQTPPPTPSPWQGEGVKGRDGLHVLDSWILSRLNELIELTTTKLDNYKLLEPVRGFREFVDDLSTWYLRRSRERIKNGDKDAINTLHYVLKTFAKVLAPFAPFTAEDLYQKLRIENDPESVHLENWPSASKGQTLSIDSQGLTLENMSEIRRLTTLALEQRQKANIKVRQPLQKLEIKSLKLIAEYQELISDEINVKEIIENPNLETEVKLDITITPELEEEGKVRDIIRSIQDWRKEQGLQPGDIVDYKVSVDKKELFEKNKVEIENSTNVKLVGN
ncbi:MAG: class I tRNA ligase family protein [bacterium]